MCSILKFLKILLPAVITVLVIIIFNTIIIRSQSTKQLDEIQKIKAENFKLKSQLLQCQVSVSNTELSKQQSQLIEEFRKELGATNEEVFDWNTLTFSKSDSKSK